MPILSWTLHHLACPTPPPCICHTVSVGPSGRPPRCSCYNLPTGHKARSYHHVPRAGTARCSSVDPELFPDVEGWKACTFLQDGHHLVRIVRHAPQVSHNIINQPLWRVLWDKVVRSPMPCHVTCQWGGHGHVQVGEGLTATRWWVFAPGLPPDQRWPCSGNSDVLGPPRCPDSTVGHGI